MVRHPLEIELATFQFYMKCLNALGHYPEKTDVKRLQLLILFSGFIATYPTNRHRHRKTLSRGDGQDKNWLY